MKKILFLTDFSEAANKAYIYALHLAHKTNAEILVVHTYEQPNFKTVALPNTLREIYKQIELEEFQAFRDKVPVLKEIEKQENLEHLNIKHALREGQTIPTILRTIKEEKPDLVVMGTKGATGLRELFLGSVTGEIMENAIVPVLGVPKKGNFNNGIKKMLFLTNFQEEEKVALEKVRTILEGQGTELYCVHVNLQDLETAKERMEKWKATIPNKEALFYEIVEALDLERQLIQYIKANNVDAVAMLTHKRNFFQELFMFSLTKQLSYHLTIPVLAVQHKK